MLGWYADWAVAFQWQERGFCRRGDSIVALHRIGNASVIKVRVCSS